MSKYYVTIYREYPLYEAAEGGYYYAGVELDESTGCESLKEARAIMNDIVLNEYELDKDGYEKWNLNK